MIARKDDFNSPFWEDGTIERSENGFHVSNVRQCPGNVMRKHMRTKQHARTIKVYRLITHSCTSYPYSAEP